MADLSQLLTHELRLAMAAALGDEHAAADPVLRRSDHADYQANAAMALGKRLRRPPREIAQAIVDHLDRDGVHGGVAGPGFVNLDLDDAFLGRLVDEHSQDPRLGVPTAASSRRVVVDYSAPNVAKEMHVGHLRSSVIGDAIVRVLAFRGHDVIRQNHVGDWGTQFGMLIEHVVERGVDLDDRSALRDVTGLYREAQARFETEPEFATRARERVVSLQAGDPATRAAWARLVARSEEHFGDVYRTLGVLLAPDDVRGESAYNDQLDDVVAELTGKGLLVEDEGALCAFLPETGDETPLIVRKRDGGFGYAATDLAALRYRLRDLGAERVVYVVDARQSRHFTMVFALARRAGWLHEGVTAEHVAFGTILGPDNRPLRTRAGDNVALTDVLDEAVTRARAVVEAKNPELPPGEREQVAATVGIGALKYADLTNDRIKDYVFDWDRLLSFDGNTAPYLQYANVRIRSVFARAGVAFGTARGPARPTTRTEHALALELLRLPEVVASVEETLQPHRLAAYLYRLSTSFTAFYEECQILVDDAAVRASRLLLAQLCALVLERGLGLLGIEVPDRM